MARLAGVTAREAGLSTRLAYFFTRRVFTRLTGREPERMYEGTEVTAHAPEVLRAYGKLEQANAKLRRVDRRVKWLAELKAATLVHCEFCIDFGSQVMRHTGVLSDEELLALPNYRSSPLFTDVDKLVLDYTVGITRTPAEVSDELFSALRKHFDAAQLVELTHAVALGNMRGRFNVGLGIGAAGFSEGMVCAVPETVSQPAPRQEPIQDR
jgi:alkylhydroperoxidase family enzyme